MNMSSIVRCVLVVSVFVFGSHPANAACVIHGARPTVALPTIPAGQEFSFIASPDCETLRFTIRGTTVSETPRALAPRGPGVRTYIVSLTQGEWDAVVAESGSTITWVVTGKTITGETTRMFTTNDLKPDEPSTIPAPDVVVAGTEGTWFGEAIEVADIDGDGASDLLAAARGKDGLRGAVYVAQGPITASTTTAGLVVLSGTITDGEFGSAVDGGDENGDGVDDVIVGADGDANAAYLFLGPVTADRDDTDADAILEGHLYTRTGADVDVIPDFDGNGTPDLAIGAPYAGLSEPGVRRGAVYILSGPTSGTVDLVSDATYTYEGRGFFDNLGYANASAGDQNGDGVDDIVMMDADEYVYLVDGGATPGTYTVDAAASAVVYGPLDFAGAMLTSVDYDEDGSPDLLVGAPGADSSSGAVYGFMGPLSGSLRTSDADVSWISNDSDVQYLGVDVATGDADGDSKPDVVMGAQWTGSGYQDLAAFVQLGFASGAVDVGTLVTVRGQDAEQVGRSVAMIPDWSGDGADEVAIATPYRFESDTMVGAVYVFFSEGLAL